MGEKGNRDFRERTDFCKETYLQAKHYLLNGIGGVRELHLLLRHFNLVLLEEVLNNVLGCDGVEEGYKAVRTKQKKKEKKKGQRQVGIGKGRHSPDHTTLPILSTPYPPTHQVQTTTYNTQLTIDLAVQLLVVLLVTLATELERNALKATLEFVFLSLLVNRLEIEFDGSIGENL